MVGALVNYAAIDKFDAPGSRYQTENDFEGTFKIGGIGGAILLVNVTKQGYRTISGESDAALAYGMPPDANRKAPPSGVATFRLYKAGEVRGNLIHAVSRQLDVPPDGRPVSIDLAKAQIGKGDLIIKASCGDTSLRPFDWRFRLSVPNGGLIENSRAFDFVAPSDG